MYYKYSGEDKEAGKVRVSFLTDGLFRFTQPRKLNDPKEGRPRLFVNEYSPKDIELARNKMNDSQFICLGDEMCDEDVIKLGLNPCPARRYGDVFPHLVKQKGFNNMQEYDEAQLETAYESFDNQLNNEVGVFSLTTDQKNQVMWTSYCNDYNGIVVGFSHEIKSLHGCIAQNIEYDLGNVEFQLSLNKGVIRFNGLKVQQAQNDGFDITDDLLKSFLFHKEKRWDYEGEFRILSWLKNTEKKIGNVYLRKIPFNIFKSVYIGCKVIETEKDNILKRIQENNELSHVNIYQQEFSTITGDIEFKQIKF